MTIAEAYELAPAYRPNNKAEESDVLRWINDVESRIHKDILMPYFHFEKPFVPYTMATPTSTKLLADVGYDRLYQYWICASIDMLQGDSERYNESIERFNNLFEEYAGYIARTHLAKHRPMRYW